jgi:hypothetical protein
MAVCGAVMMRWRRMMQLLRRRWLRAFRFLRKQTQALNIYPLVKIPRGHCPGSLLV